MEEQFFSEILASGRAGCRKSLGRLFKLCEVYLLERADSELLGRLGTRLDSWDMVQETFLRACAAFQAFHGRSTGEWRSWLLHILRNAIRDRVRALSRGGKRNWSREQSMCAEDADVVTADLKPYEEACRHEWDTAIHTALERLRDEERTVMRLRFWDGYSFRAIGATLGCSKETARQIYSTAMGTLRLTFRGGGAALEAMTLGPAGALVRQSSGEKSGATSNSC